MAEYIAEEIREGYCDVDLQPIKCRCGAKDSRDEITDRDEHGILEYRRMCKVCGAVMGNWAYGHWEP